MFFFDNMLKGDFMGKTLYYYDGISLKKYCKNCDKKLGHYAYGNWDL